MAQRLVPSIPSEVLPDPVMPLDDLQSCANYSYIDFENRKEEITHQLVDAAENSGFLSLVDHDITIEEIEAQFAISKKFFDLPLETKHKIPFDATTSLGFEYKTQKRATTGVDQKESLLIRRSPEQWPSDEDVPKFHETTEKFLTKCASISQQVLHCFAIALGFPEDYFEEPMDPTKPDSLNQLRFLHYPASENNAPEGTAGSWRAGAHTDFGVLTLLFQLDGGDGLEICPGRESHTSNAHRDAFFPVPAKTGPIVINIGDMLMSWSDDRFKANYHRVRAEKGKCHDRYSIAYFNQGREDFIFQGPKKKYEPITYSDYVHNHIASFFPNVIKVKKSGVGQREFRKLVSAAS